MCAALCAGMLLTGCGSEAQKEDETVTEQGTTKEQQTTAAVEEKEVCQLKVDETVTYQTMESFGASGAWWSQDVGGWMTVREDGQVTREYIAKLLFDREEGIGLSGYRYNIGAGSDDGNSDITDLWRQAQSFVDESGNYDWDKDANAVWFLNQAVEYGVEDITFFVNSPLVSLTKNGKAHADADAENKSNLPAENYEAFAEYVLDVTEHFVQAGIPVTYLSPINEPQWEWTGGQEGCHYEPAEVVEVLKVFAEKLEERKSLSNVALSAPESGEWGNTNYPYCEAILKDEVLSTYFKTWDIHSYWTDKATKQSFAKWLDAQKVQPELKTSEWCEMVNGKDYTISSALNLSKEITEDLTILDVTSWQYWIAVSCYNYRDGLIYVSTVDEFVGIPKRFWAMGNYSRFIRPGYVRVEGSCKGEDVTTVAFTGINENSQQELIVVLTNSSESEKEVTLEGMVEYQSMEVFVTSEAYNLECTLNTQEIPDCITLDKKSITTIRLKK